MNDLELWSRRSGGLLPSRNSRSNEQDLTTAAHTAKVAALRVDAAAAVTARRMDRTAALDAQRRVLAPDNPTLDAVLSRIELGFVIATEGLTEDAAGKGFRL